MREILHGNVARSARQTLSLLFDQREAFRTSSPYSASTVAFGSQFLYNHGSLCYIRDDQIRILEICNRLRTERVVSGHVLKSQMTNALGLRHLADDFLQYITLLSYADDILVLMCEETLGPAAWLLALDLKIDNNMTKDNEPCRRICLRRRLASKTKLFVRHDRNYLYYGTHSGQRDDGHHEWQIQGCNLSTGRAVSLKSLRLNEFVGSEIGSTACFEIHDGHLYALSNQTSFDTEEVDWTSCYHFVRFRLEAASPDLKLCKIWRRQHHEGPINDAWTNLSLQFDEQNSELKIIEVRKEWLGGGSLCARTSYTTYFAEASDEDLILDRPNFPSNDQLSRTLDEHSKPSWLEKPPERIPKYCHHEHTPDSKPHQEFIRAKTKHHSYNSFAHAFVDLVADEIRTPNSFRSKDRLRLRIASRIPESPLIPVPLNAQHLNIRPQRNDHKDDPIPGSEETFTDTSVSLWPPTDAPTELFDLLCPGGRVGNVHAVSDERSIIYMAGTPHAQHNNQRAIIMISFDPGWGHKGLKRLRNDQSSVRTSQDIQLDIRRSDTSACSRRIGTAHDVSGDVDMKNPTAEKSNAKRLVEVEVEAESSTSASKRQRVEESASASGTTEPQRLFWTEPAMYLSINQGFWLR